MVLFELIFEICMANFCHGLCDAFLALLAWPFSSKTNKKVTLESSSISDITPTPVNKHDWKNYETLQEETKQQISCPPCRQLLNIPKKYTGQASCPKCKEIIRIENGLIID